jgi:hypothetical protein
MDDGTGMGDGMLDDMSTRVKSDQIGSSTRGDDRPEVS